MNAYSPWRGQTLAYFKGSETVETFYGRFTFRSFINSHLHLVSVERETITCLRNTYLRLRTLEEPLTPKRSWNRAIATEREFKTSKKHRIKWTKEEENATAIGISDTRGVRLLATTLMVFADQEILVHCLHNCRAAIVIHRHVFSVNGYLCECEESGRI